jgi:shikimate kinase
MQQIKSNIILLGFMGSGKTSVGKLLAADSKLHFIDLDQQIEKNKGLLISEIFQKYGEQYFRELEKKAILNLKGLKDSVISLGGGAFCSAENIKTLKEIGVSIYLQAGYANLSRRYSEAEISKRPLLQNQEKAEELLHNREVFYKQAELIIATDGRSPEEIKTEIVKQLSVLKGFKGI